VITPLGGLRILIEGVLMAAAGVTAFALTYQDGQDLERARTVAFCTLAFTQLFFSFACRSNRFTLPELGPFSNPYLFAAIAASTLLQVAVATLPFTRSIFALSPLTGRDWRFLLPLSLAPVSIVEIAKLIRAAFRPRRAAGSASEARPTPGAEGER
jgi:Ca2+-transporting ATPase